jgi:hypothetical protein
MNAGHCASATVINAAPRPIAALVTVGAAVYLATGTAIGMTSALARNAMVTNVDQIADAESVVVVAVVIVVVELGDEENRTIG